MTRITVKEGYNKVVVYGDPERTHIVMVRDNKNESETTISRHPGFLERIFPACYMRGLMIMTPTEEIYRDRIKRAIEIMVDFAYSYDQIDAKEEEKLVKKKRLQEEGSMDFERFLMEQVRP